MSVLDKAEINLKKENLDMKEILKKVAENIQISTSANIDFEFLASKHIIHADRLHITNIIYNLLDNAVKYSELEPKVFISTKDSKNGLLICIKDNGKGIKPGDQKKIFQKFYRVSQGNVHDIKGFGLGLYYVKKLTIAHKGEISLTSEINKGSTFIIFLPYE
jgi:two-component system, OmpR family, phosphate regulon sensor histidine kinase PhoR